MANTTKKKPATIKPPVKKQPRKKAARKLVKKANKKKKAKKPVVAKVKRNPKAKVKKATSTKKVAKPLLEKKNKGYKQLKDGSYRIYGWRVVDAPRAGFPELVIVEHTGKRIKKQFINMPAAVKYIESQESEKLIDSGGKAVLKELKSVGLGPLVSVADDPLEEADATSVIEQESEENEANDNE